LKRLSYYFLEKILELSIPISTELELEGLLKTTLGQKLNSDFLLFYENLFQILPEMVLYY